MSTSRLTPAGSSQSPWPEGTLSQHTVWDVHVSVLMWRSRATLAVLSILSFYLSKTGSLLLFSTVHTRQPTSFWKFFIYLLAPSSSGITHTLAATSAFIRVLGI